MYKITDTENKEMRMGAGIRVGKQELEQETRDRLPFSFKVTGQL
jgi:hypothetical protein